MGHRPSDDENYQRFLGVLETITDGFISLDPNLRYTYLNQAAKRVLESQGVTNVLGKHIFDVFPDVRESEGARAIRRVMTERIPLELETFSTRSQRWYANRFIPTADGGVSILFNDITDRKQAEQALRHAKEFDEAVMNNMGEGLYTVDREGLVTMMNLAAEKLLGWTLEELRGKKMHDVTHYVHLDGSPFSANQCAGLKVMEQGIVLANHPDVFIRKNGTFFDVVYSSSPIREGDRITGLVVVFRDVSEEKRSDELLKQSARQLGLIADTAPVFIAHCDSQHRFLFVNKPYADRFKLNPEDCIGKPIAEIIGPEAYASIREYIEIVLNGQRIDFEVEVPYVRIGTRFMHCSYAPEFDAAGNVIGWVAAITDITDRKRIEEALQESQKQLREALEASWEASRLKDEFLATVSHELRTPLQSILGWAGLLRNPNSNIDTSSAIESIYKSAKNQAQTIEDLLDVSRIITGKLQLRPQTVLVNVVINNVVDSLQPGLLAKNISLHLHLSEDKNQPIIYGDPDRLQQVIWNLLTNAIKFTAENGIIEIEIRKIGKSVEIIVSDNGKGITPEFLPFVFDRFRQADSSSTRSAGGLGLGLAIVKQLVELQGGTVEAKSPGEDQGSTFIISLPIGAALSQITTPEVNVSTRIESNPKVPKQLSGLNVLLVDGEPETLRSLQLSLSQAAAKVKSAKSVSEAIDILRNWIPDVLVTDIVMAEEDGYSFIKKFRALNKNFRKHIPALALSAYARAEDRSVFLSSGFEMFLPKPVEEAELIAALVALTRPLKGKKILLVEDDVLSAEMFRSYFESKGADAKIATRSSQALSILNDWIPDVLVSDLGLPEQDGFSLIKNLRSSSNAKLVMLPAIAITGYGKEDGERAIAAGFGSYLLKPIEPIGLEEAVVHMLNPARTS
jgi:PAS domain S-box-containing protein